MGGNPSSGSEPAPTDRVDRVEPVSDPAPPRSGYLVQWCYKCDRRTCRCPKPDYAHAGRRRKRITEDLFRCKLPLILKGEKIPCNALVWRKPDEMRAHMLDHYTEDEIAALDDDAVRARFMEAARVPQEGIPDDDDED